MFPSVYTMSQTVCSIGKAAVDNIVCTENDYSRDKLTPEELRLLRLRTGSKKRISVLCKAHAINYLWSYAAKQDQCCDPFLTHSKKNKVIRSGIEFEIKLDHRDKAKLLNLDPPVDLIPGKRLCISCKISLLKKFKTNGIDAPSDMQSSPSQSSSTSASVPSQTVQEDQHPQPHKQPSPDYIHNSQSCLENLNNWLKSNGEEEIDFQKLIKQKTYLVQQLDKVNRVLKVCASVDQSDTSSVSNWYEKSVLYDEFVYQLQEYIKSSKSKADHIHALSVLPRSLSVEEIKAKFPSVSNRLARRTQELIDKTGILCTPNKKIGRPTSTETVQLVTDFYLRQDVSKEQVGKNQVISIKGSDGKRVRKQKRLLLGNIVHLHQEFMKEFPNCEISFPKFAQLRPKECVLVSSSGVHNVCVCVHHENPELMFHGARLKNMTLFKRSTDCLKILMCSPPSVDCNLRTCKECCGKSSELRDQLLPLFDQSFIEDVTFNQWENTDRANLVTITCSVEEFVERFINQLQELIPHHFIFKTQAEYFRSLQANLDEGEILVVGDFAENYSFDVQDEVYAYYFGSKKQCTIHPFSVYFKGSETDEKKQYSFAVISDCMEHNSVTFYTFQKKLIDHLKEKYNIEKIYYFSDGCGGQYKNRKMAANLCYHERDFGIKAEWNFFATAHGKSACDGIGGSIKRRASEFAMVNKDPGAQITTAYKLYEWCLKNENKIHPLWVSKAEVGLKAEFLAVRYEGALPIDGIQSIHQITPEGENFVILKRYSAALHGERREISRAEEGVSWENIRGFVIFWDKREPKWYLGTVQEKHEDTASLSIEKLQLKENRKYDYEYPDNESSTIYQADCVLILPETTIMAKGTLVRIKAAESKVADAVLKKKTLSVS
ncbi:hypothetical protein FOCC_FOCC015922 [Frankliniella occidentalis]|nr:hypothetical protein FOCC_FOCC015922 [Frankliniella occidentalis]